jgi:predicted TIM-barrel fold metal-dependent hydrolase
MISRREFVAGVAAAAVQSAIAAGDDSVEIIDTHTHFYDPERPGGVPWPSPSDKLLYRRVLPPEYTAMAKPLGVVGTVVIEASPRMEDNDWLLGLADPFLLGIVGNLDPLDSGFDRNLDRLASNPRFLGIRVSGMQMLQRGTEQGYLRAMKRLADAGRALDLNGPRDYLGAVAPLARSVPNLRIIIDHVGSAGDPRNLSPDWRDGMRAVAEAENVFCKVSGLPEQVKGEAGKAPVDVDFYRPILDAVFAGFGADRLVFGSNWPVSNHGASFVNVVKMAREYFEVKGPDVQRRVFSANARRFYRWPRA